MSDIYDSSITIKLPVAKCSLHTRKPLDQLWHHYLLSCQCYKLKVNVQIKAQAHCACTINAGFKAIHLIHINILKRFNSQTDQHRVLQNPRLLLQTQGCAYGFCTAVSAEGYWVISFCINTGKFGRKRVGIQSIQAYKNLFLHFVLKELMSTHLARTRTLTLGISSLKL